MILRQVTEQQVKIYTYISIEGVQNKFIILTNCLLIITIFVTMLLNENKYLQNTKKACYKRKKTKLTHIMCYIYET